MIDIQSWLNNPIIVGQRVYVGSSGLDPNQSLWHQIDSAFKSIAYLVLFLRLFDEQCKGYLAGHGDDQRWLHLQVQGKVLPWPKAEKQWLRPGKVNAWLLAHAEKRSNSNYRGVMEDDAIKK